jgi:hypothetical protein
VPGIGVDRSTEVIQYGLRAGLITKRGSWFDVETTGTGYHGQEELKWFLDQERYQREELERQIMQEISHA